jgi:threonine/homoserine/homoserine lactone efflux protein
MLAYFAVLMVPGSILITTASLAAENGVGKAVPFVVGASAGTGGTVVLIGAATSNLAIPWGTLQQVGSVVLLILAFGIVRTPTAVSGSKAGRLSVAALLAAGLAAAISSPMTPIFTLNFLATEGAAARGPALATLALTIMAMNLLWYSLVATALAMPKPRAIAVRHLSFSRWAAAVILCAVAFNNLIY